MKKTCLLIIITLATVLAASSVEASFISKIIPSFGEHHKRNHHTAGMGYYANVPLKPIPDPPGRPDMPFAPDPPGNPVVPGNPVGPGTPCNPVPEPSTAILIGVGLAGLAVAKRGKGDKQ